MRNRIRLMKRNWRLASWFGFPLHLCIKAAWNGFWLKCKNKGPWEEDIKENQNQEEL